MIKIFRIEGESMLPEYQDGEFVLLWRTLHPKVGDVVVFENQLYGTLIKRVAKISEQGVYVLGTGENSLDSRRLGPVSPEKIQGRVIWHIRKKDRR